MAQFDARRLDNNMFRKESSILSVKLTKAELGSTDGALVAVVPDNVYIEDCYVRIITAVTGAASVDIGWGTANNQISNDLSLAGAADSVASGAPSTPVHSGDTKKEIVIKPNAAMTAGEVEFVIRISEPAITKGDLMEGPQVEKF